MGERILIVDDEVNVLNLCRRILEMHGYQVCVARNGYDAIDLARQKSFDLLLTDIKMPAMNGLEIAQAIKKSDPNVICVTMTGHSTVDMVLEALKLGIDEFILKPFSPDELSMAVAKTLEKVRLRKENIRLRSLIPLFELNKTLMATVEEEKVLNCLLEISRAETRADVAGLYTADRHIIPPHLQDWGITDENQLTQQTCDKLADLIFQNGQQMVLSLEDSSDEYRPILEQLGIHSTIATPLKSKKTNLSVLILARKERDFAPSDSDFLAVLSSQASIALENAHLFAEIQEAYQKLQVLDHMKSEFINIAAHELRTPLSIMVGYAAVLEEIVDVPHEYISIITRNAMHLRALVEDILNLQYLESGMISLARNHLDLPTVMAEALQDMALLIQEKNLNIKVNIPDDFPAIIADRKKLDLIIMNLFDNAIKFTPEGGLVTFTAGVEGEWVRMSVTDSGVGIPQEKLERIFDRFYQVEDSLTRVYEGMGLGLAIVRGMVDVCGGEISVTSREGEGTTFTFTIPLDNSHLEKRPLKL